MSGRYAHGFHVAGWGHDPTYGDGTLFVTEAGEDLEDGEVGDFAIKVALSSEATQNESVGYRVNPVKRGEEGIASSARTFVVPARDDLVTTFAHVQHETTLFLELELLGTDVYIDFSESTTTPSELEGEVIWVDKEAVLLGSYNSSNNAFENSTRGYFSSDASYHPAGQNVYASHPQGWDGRRVRLLRIDLDRLTARQMWPGRIDLDDEQSEITTDETGADLLVPATDLTATQSDVRVRHELHTPTDVIADDDTPGLRIDATGDPPASYSGEVRGEQQVTKGSTYPADTGILWRIGETLAYADGDTLETQGALGSPRPDGGDDPLREADLRDPPHQVFVVDRNFDERTDHHFGQTPISSTRELDDQPSSVGGVTTAEDEVYPYHPLAVALSLELSERGSATTPAYFDVLQTPDWSADRRGLYTDRVIEEAHALIRQTAGLQIDQLVLGWPRDPVELVTQIDRLLLHPFGFFRCLDSRGEMRIRRFRLGDVDDLLDAETGAFGQPVTPIPRADRPGPLKFATGRGGVVDAVEILYDGLPWREPKSIFYSPTEGEAIQPDQVRQEASYTLDLSTIRDRSTAIRMAQRSGRLQAAQAPKLRVRVPSQIQSGADYGTGDFLGLDDLPLRREALVDPDGDRVNNIGVEASFAMLLVGARYEMSSMTWTLDGRMTNFVDQQIVQLRAVSAVVIDVGTNAEGDVDRVYVAPESNFGATGSDAEEFEPGDEVAFHRQTLGLRGSGPEVEIADISDTTTTTPNTGEDAYEISFGSPLQGSDAPQADDFMRFGRYGPYDNPGHNGRYATGFGPVHVWLADSEGTLGAAEDQEAVYG